MPCPFCHLYGTLILHGYLKSKPDDFELNYIIRGHRIFCSDRDKKNGCGRTYSLKLSVFIGKLSIKAYGIWQFLVNLLKGNRPYTAFKKTGLPYSNSSIYRLYQRFIHQQSYIRSLLTQIMGPDLKQNTSSSILQTITHLKNSFIHHLCPVSAFQNHFQVSFL